MSESVSSNGVVNGIVAISSNGHDVYRERDADYASDHDDDVKLSEFFNAAHAAVLEIESCDATSNDVGFQTRIADAARQLEWATVAASGLDLFSSNEGIEELPTSSLKFLLLPAYLGRLTNKKTIDSTSSSLSGGPAVVRKKLVDMAVVYFEDFLTRLGDYGVFSGVIPTKAANDASENDNPASSRATDLKAMNAEREAKIRRFKESKERGERLAAFEERRKTEKLTEEEEREYWMENIEDYMNRTIEDLTSLKEERDILAFMAKRSAGSAPEPAKPPSKNHNGNPFAGRPFILTRDSVQKQVFGMGYPSLPSMTVEEWYDEQAALGLLPTPVQSRLQMDQAMMANDPDVRRQEEEQKEIEEEKREEEDDMEERRKKNEWDDWKDDHRRGWGNRKNMG